MNTLRLRLLVLLLLVGGGLATSGCQRQSSTETVHQKIDRAAEAVAANADGAERAAEVVASTAGAAAAAAGDAALTAKVKSALVSQLDVAALSIQVETKDAIVTLSGSVDSALERERAKRAALGVPGIRYLLDSIVVKSPQPG